MADHRWQRPLTNPLAVAQVIGIGVPLAWLFVMSVRHWQFADPPTGLTLEGYLRLLSEGPARTGFSGTLVLTAWAALLAVVVGAPAAFYAARRPRLGILLLALLAAPSFAATPVRAEAWRNVAALLGTEALGWAAVPSMVAAAVPFASLLLFLGIRDLQQRDLQLAKVQGIPFAQRLGRIWGGPIASAVGGAWLFSGLVILFDLGTPTELYRGSVYLLADELRSRTGVQAWSQLAADGSVMVIVSACIVLGSASLLAGRLRSRHVTVEGEAPWSWLAAAAVLPAILLVVAPTVGLLLGSVSNQELVLSLEGGGSLRWWREAWQNSRLDQAISRSVIDAALALGVGIPLGIAAAVVDWRRRLRGGKPSGAVFVVWFLPWLAPPAALGIAAALLMRRIGLSPGLVMTGLFHALFVAPVAAALCRARLNRISSDDIRLARVLGIPSRAVFFHLVLHEIGGAIALSAVVGAAIVWTEVPFAELICGMDETLPVMLRGISRSGGTPIIDVVGSITVVLAAIAVLAVWMFNTTRKAWSQ